MNSRKSPDKSINLNYEMKSLHFIHIPKNGGHSITHLIKNNEFANAFSHFHNENPLKFPKDRSFLILRDPIDRFISAFNYAKQFYPNCELSKHVEIVEPSDLVKKLKNGDDSLILDGNHYIGKNKTRIAWTFYPQHNWYNGAKYVLFFENLKNDFEEFLKKTDRPLIELPKLNASHRKFTHLTVDDMNFLKEMYKDDYELIEKKSKQEWKYE
jgi:hypothetical protein